MSPDYQNLRCSTSYDNRRSSTTAALAPAVFVAEIAVEDAKRIKVDLLTVEVVCWCTQTEVFISPDLCTDKGNCRGQLGPAGRRKARSKVVPK